MATRSNDVGIVRRTIVRADKEGLGCPLLVNLTVPPAERCLNLKRQEPFS